ncbi:hypothetical protein C8Q79DRAFT_387316 [Trametes meyenii]|nr:hypothetical protein C8Q79DRAFT_387316 [Trametes meyenii]
MCPSSCTHLGFLLLAGYAFLLLTHYSSLPQCPQFLPPLPGLLTPSVRPFKSPCSHFLPTSGAPPPGPPGTSIWPSKAFSPSLLLSLPAAPPIWPYTPGSANLALHQPPRSPVLFSPPIFTHSLHIPLRDTPFTLCNHCFVTRYIYFAACFAPGRASSASSHTIGRGKTASGGGSSSRSPRHHASYPGAKDDVQPQEGTLENNMDYGAGGDALRLLFWCRLSWRRVRNSNDVDGHHTMRHGVHCHGRGMNTRAPNGRARSRRVAFARYHRRSLGVRPVDVADLVGPARTAVTAGGSSGTRGSMRRRSGSES